jgi:undecaprenyl pyrophosphate phosphatase UppP
VSYHLTYLQAVVTGLVQGVTELFPISSLGHNVLLPALVGGSWTKTLNVSATGSPYLAFIVGLHVATAVAMIAFFWRDWLRIVRGFFSSIGERRIATPDQRLAWMIILGTIPVGIVGLVAQKEITKVLAKPDLAAVFLAVNGVILLVSERMRRDREARGSGQAAVAAAPRAAFDGPADGPGYGQPGWPAQGYQQQPRQQQWQGPDPRYGGDDRQQPQNGGQYGGRHASGGGQGSEQSGLYGRDQYGRDEYGRDEYGRGVLGQGQDQYGQDPWDGQQGRGRHGQQGQEQHGRDQYGQGQYGQDPWDEQQPRQPRQPSGAGYEPRPDQWGGQQAPGTDPWGQPTASPRDARAAQDPRGAQAPWADWDEPAPQGTRPAQPAGRHGADAGARAAGGGAPVGRQPSAGGAETDAAVEADRRLSTMTLWRAVTVGAAQILALLPGISRDGIVTVAGMGRGLRREDAVRFSFLLSAPVILAAGALKMSDLTGPASKGMHGPIIVGSLIAGIGAYVSIRFLVKYFSEDKSLNPFGFYCIIAGLGSLAYLVIK